MLSFPITTGANIGSGDWTFAVGWHPEVIVACIDDDDTGLGIGAYGDVSVTSSPSWAAAGVTFVDYLPHYRAVALSAGIADSDGHVVPSLGVFSGWRLIVDNDHLDYPLGVRVDVRPGRDGVSTSVSVLAEVDVVPLAYLGWRVLSALAHPD